MGKLLPLPLNMTQSPPQYRCPLCQQPLTINNNSFWCVHAHSFDQAKEGYVNLLPVQFKHSKQPGDNKAMVNARRAFLEKGYYQPLISRLIELYQRLGKQNGTVFDAGCGEGYYTNQHKTFNNQVYGVDIAKEAIKKAAKKYKACHFSVATLSQLPYKNEFFDWIFSIYAPILETEFTRILQTGGYLVTVTPAQKHLIELKQRIYQQANEHDTARSQIDHLTLISEEHLSYSMAIRSGEDLLNLLSMTPFAFKASEEIKQQLVTEQNFNCQADFLIRIYQK